MKKGTYYFSHDYNARVDEKIKRLIRSKGMVGYGVYWAIIEDLYNNANALQTDYEGIAYDLHISENIVESVVKDFDLFEINGNVFGSISVKRRLEEIVDKSAKARESASYRWKKKQVDANALQTQTDRNAIKEKKRKEKKEIMDFVSDDYVDVINEWFEYKKEKGQSYKSLKSKKLLFEKLKKLSNGSPELAKKIIEQSISNNWAGLFELKETPKETQTEGITFKIR